MTLARHGRAHVRPCTGDIITRRRNTMNVDVTEVCRRAVAANDFVLRTTGLPADFFWPSEVYLCGAEGDNGVLVEVYLDMYNGTLYRKLNEMDYDELPDFDYEELAGCTEKYLLKEVWT